MNNYIDLKNTTDFSSIKIAAESIKNGKLVLFPTETVYGIGADGLNENAVKNIFIAKGRKQDNPLILHISDIKMIDKIAKNVSNIEQKLISAFFPGPFTIILERQDIVPDIVTGGLNTVGIRMPSNEIAKELIKLADTPIAAPSANISGRPSGTNVTDIFNELQDKVDTIIDGGECKIGVESTVVRVINNIPHILRPGKITPEQIKSVAGDVILDKHIFQKVSDEKSVLSPGMKYRHYAPNSKCILVYSNDNEKMITKINEISKKYKNPLIICKTENKNNYSSKTVIDIYHENRLEELSKNIFHILRTVDSYAPDIVIIEGVKKEGLGLAIMNRLIRACENNYIEIE
jgi:L-threonylcarbamoyladenylate synthase